MGPTVRDYVYALDVLLTFSLYVFSYDVKKSSRRDQEQMVGRNLSSKTYPSTYLRLDRSDEGR